MSLNLESHLWTWEYNVMRHLLPILFLLLAACEARPVEPEPLQWAYVLPESFQASEFERRLDGYAVLCLGVYRLNAAGHLYVAPALNQTQWNKLQELRTNRKLYALISLAGARDGESMLSSPVSRARAVRELQSLARTRTLDGVHIDFEFLRAAYKHHFAAFLRQLRQAQTGTISIAAFPPFHGQPEEVDFFDPAVIGPEVDEIVYMTYDYHYPGSKPGPVTHIAWAEQNMREALKQLPANRLWLGVPLYGYLWKQTRRGVPISEAQGRALAEKFGSKRDDSMTVRIRLPDGEASYSDGQTKDAMRSLARTLKLRGTADWRIGFEELRPPAMPGETTP